MAMKPMQFLVTVEIERDEGKFVGRDEIAEAIMDAIEQANPETLDSLGADGNSTYSIVDWAVEQEGS